MVMPGKRIVEKGSEDTDDTDSVGSGIASIGDIGESSVPDRTASDMLASDIPSSPLHTHSYGKAKKVKKDRTLGFEVVYISQVILTASRRNYIY